MGDLYVNRRVSGKRYFIRKSEALGKGLIRFLIINAKSII